MNTNQIQIQKTTDHMSVVSPYIPSFPPAARNLGGKWNPSAAAWIFDVRDEERVRDLLMEVYGTDGSPETGADLVTLRVTLNQDWAARTDPLYLAGRCVARAYGRDSGAKLGDGVVVVAGRFTSGGSVKNWNTVGRAGTVFEIRDLPRAAAGKAAESFERGDAQIIEPSQPDRKAQLMEEKAVLLARLAEINAEIGD